MWRGAWQRFEDRLAVGAGADAATIPEPAPTGSTAGTDSSGQAASSPEPLLLRVLGDTGLVGGVLLFGGVLLAIAGILWPRTAAVWRKSVRPGAKAAQSARWGSDTVLYGWQMSLLVGLAFWFSLANMEPLWQMPGLTVPALLMLGAALARTDSRAGTLWPKIRQRLQRKRRRAAVATVETITPRGRRFLSHLPHGHLRPPGTLSQAFRVMLLVVSAVVVVLAVCAYFYAV
jgi:hypothetical protein